MFRSGVCSWTDPSLIQCGKFYKKGGKHDELLRFYATKKPCVEVDASTYVIPTVNRVKKWLEATPKGFVFHFKAHQIFTHGNSDYAKLPRVIRDVWAHPHGPNAKEIQLEDIPESIQEQLMFLFNLALKEVHQAEKLGVVVFQFPENFVCNDANKALILKFRRWLEAPFKMGLELRSDTWFFDAADHADFKAGTREPPQDTSVPTTRFRETLAWVEAAGPLVTLIPLDEYAKRDAKPSEQVPHPRRVTPIVTQLTGDEMYVRVHRRVGEDRLLTDGELREWAQRIAAMPVKPRRFWMMWNTNHEMQAFENAQRLEALLPAGTVLDWKEHYLEAQKANKGSILSFFGASPKKNAAAGAPAPAAAAAAAAAPADKKRASPPRAASVAAAPSAQKKTKPDAAAFFGKK